MTAWVTDGPEMAPSIRAVAADIGPAYGLTVEQAEAALRKLLRQREAGHRGIWLVDDDIPTSFDTMLEKMARARG